VRIYLLSLLLIVTIITTGCPKNSTSNNPNSNNSNSIDTKDYRREIAVEIHRVENTLLRLTELKRQFTKEGKIDKEANLRISRILLQINDVTLAVNKFLKFNPDITPANKQELVKLITDSLSYISELDTNGPFISDSNIAKQFFEFVSLLRTAFYSAQIIIEGIK
jgi:hypothetical protein